MLGIIDRMKEKMQKTEVYKSIFRHSYQDTQRNRALQIVDNVFLHLHPVRISRHATNIGYTWGMGGITFLLFIVLTVTGVILMFYYRPAGEYAYDDMKYLMNDVAFGPLMRNMHRWAAHANKTQPGYGDLFQGRVLILLRPELHFFV